MSLSNMSTVYKMMNASTALEDPGNTQKSEEKVVEEGVEKMLNSHSFWVYFGEAAQANGFHTLASLIYKEGLVHMGYKFDVDVSTLGDKARGVGVLLRGMAKALRRIGRVEEAIKMGSKSIEVAPKGGERMRALLNLWSERGMGDELYAEEMEMDLGSVLDEYVVYERVDGRGVSKRELAGMEREVDGVGVKRDESLKIEGGLVVRRRASSLMLKREDKWKLLTRAPSGSNVSNAIGSSGSVNQFGRMDSGMSTASSRRSSLMLDF